MKWKAHFVIGALAAVVLIYILETAGLATLAVVALFGAFSALLPDLDLETSKGRKLLDISFIPFAMIIAYVSGCGTGICIPTISMITMFLVLVGLYFVIFMLLKPKHRGITHTIFLGLVYAIGLNIIVGQTFALAGFAGYVSHLIADRQVKFL
ncbi:metal-dependent hydrolase [Candidatus Micrarchaeota archaeon]|nr:metal-dependent hydrolase [Candidatus Micrarchaeota archaeon]